MRIGRNLGDYLVQLPAHFRNPLLDYVNRWSPTLLKNICKERTLPPSLLSLNSSYHYDILLHVSQNLLHLNLTPLCLFCFLKQHCRNSLHHLLDSIPQIFSSSFLNIDNTDNFSWTFFFPAAFQLLWICFYLPSG